MDEIERLQWFLRRIADGAGPFKPDPFEHAQSVIRQSVNLARAALRNPTIGNVQVEWDNTPFEPELDE